MFGGSLKGSAAELRWGYFPAATLGPFTLSADKTGLRLTAQVMQSDTFRLVQPGLTFCVIRPTTVWKWPVDSLHIVDGTLTATLRPQEDDAHGTEVCHTGSNAVVAR